jgi:hypothetical protein
VSKATGIITTVVGVCNTVGTGTEAGVPGPVSGARFSTSIVAVAVAPNGDIYLSNNKINSVLRVEAATGQIAVVVGTGTPAGTTVGSGPGTSVALNFVVRLKWYNGKLYIMDQGLAAVMVYDPATGQASPVATKNTWGFGGAMGIALDGSGNLFVVASQKRLEVAAPPYTTFSKWTAPDGYPNTQDDVAAGTVNFKRGDAVAVDTAGAYAYVVDTSAYCVRKVGVKWF